MKRIELLVLSFLAIAPFSTQTAIGQLPSYEQRLATFLETNRAKLEIPNLELLVVRADNVVYRYGTDPKASFETPFYVGSVSKSLTALGVLKLVEEGRLQLDSKTVEVLPNVDFSDFRDDITVRHLLNHTSGISKEQGFAPLQSVASTDASQTISVHFQPNAKHEYSNLNYCLLGLVVEKVSGLSFCEYMQEAVFNPLQMNDAHIGNRDELSSKVIPQYQYWGVFPVTSEQLDFSITSAPAGFICASSSDLANYLQMHLKNGEFQGNQVLHPSLLTIMRTPWNQEDYGYAMGWKRGSYHGVPFLQHLGATATSYCGIFLVPDKDIGFVLLTNTNSLSHTEQLMEGVLSILTDGEPPPVTRGEGLVRLGALLAILWFVGRFICQLTKLFKSRCTIVKKKELAKVVALALGFAALWFYFPNLFGIPFSAFARIQPDIGLAIASSFGLPLLMSCIRFAVPTPRGLLKTAEIPMTDKKLSITP